jgi:hypothetical protein
MAQEILCVGLTCMDIISYAHTYPIEDSDNRMEENVSVRVRVPHMASVGRWAEMP